MRVLSGDYERFARFATDATYADAGEAAARTHYGNGLGALVEGLLGRGPWDPDPARWEAPGP